MKANEFIGRRGSRESAVDDVLRFLDETALKVFFVYGTWRSGKSCVAKQAVRERDGEFRLIHQSGERPLTLEMFKEATEPEAAPKEKRRSRFPDEDLASQLIRESGPFTEGSVVFLVTASDPTEVTDKLSYSLTGRGRVARKFIVEVRKPQPEQLDELSAHTCVKGIREPEVEEYIQQILGSKFGLDQPGRRTAFSRTASQLVGRHFGLLHTLCRNLTHLDDEEDILLNQRGESEAFPRVLHDLLVGLIKESPYWGTAISCIAMSLSPKARRSLETRTICRELRVAGLVINRDGRRALPLLFHLLPRVFISYDRSDATFVERLAQDIREHGEQVWSDREAYVGDTYPKLIEEEIKRSDFFVLVVSQDSVVSDWVNREIDIALEQESTNPAFTILPALKDGNSLPEKLKQKNWADFREDKYDSGLRDLKRALDRKRLSTD